MPRKKAAAPPAETEMVICEECKSVFQVPVNELGESGICPHCESEVALASPKVNNFAVCSHCESRVGLTDGETICACPQCRKRVAFQIYKPAFCPCCFWAFAVPLKCGFDVRRFECPKCDEQNPCVYLDSVPTLNANRTPTSFETTTLDIVERQKEEEDPEPPVTQDEGKAVDDLPPEAPEEDNEPPRKIRTSELLGELAFVAAIQILLAWWMESFLINLSIFALYSVWRICAYLKSRGD